MLHIYGAPKTPLHLSFLTHICLHFLRMNCFQLKIALGYRYFYFSVKFNIFIWEINPCFQDYFFVTHCRSLCCAKPTDSLNVQHKCLWLKVTYFLANRGHLVPASVIKQTLCYYLLRSKIFSTLCIFLTLTFVCLFNFFWKIES